MIPLRTFQIQPDFSHSCAEPVSSERTEIPGWKPESMKAEAWKRRAKDRISADGTVVTVESDQKPEKSGFTDPAIWATCIRIQF